MPTASYLSRRALAAELMISESTVDEYVRRGLLPPPIRISPNCVRWRWATVDEVLKASEGPIGSNGDPSDAEAITRAIEAIETARRLRSNRPNEGPTSEEKAARAVAASKERSRPAKKLSQAERVSQAAEASRRRSNLTQAEAEGVARAIAASKERSRPAKKPKVP